MKRILGLLIGLTWGGAISAMDIDFLVENAQLDGQRLNDELGRYSGLINVGFVELLLDARQVTPYRKLLNQDFATKSRDLVANLTQQVPVEPVFQFHRYLDDKGLIDLILKPGVVSFQGPDPIVDYMLMNVAVLDELYFQESKNYKLVIDTAFADKLSMQRVKDLNYLLRNLKDSFSVAELAEVVSAAVGGSIIRHLPTTAEWEEIQKLPQSHEPVVRPRSEILAQQLEAARGGLTQSPARQLPVPLKLSPEEESRANLLSSIRARKGLRHVDQSAEPQVLVKPNVFGGRDFNDMVGYSAESQTNAGKIIHLLTEDVRGLQLKPEQEAALRAVDDTLLAEYFAKMKAVIDEDWEPEGPIVKIRDELISKHLGGQPAAASTSVAPQAVIDRHAVPAAPKGSGLSDGIDDEVEYIARLLELNDLQKVSVVDILKEIEPSEQPKLLTELKSRWEEFSLDREQFVELAHFLHSIIKKETTPYFNTAVYAPKPELSNGLHKAKAKALLDRNITQVVAKNTDLGESADVTKWRKFFKRL